MTQDITERHWDVVIIGAGLGGGVIGRTLAENGLSVLFIEKGSWGLPGESHELDETLDDPDARRMRSLWDRKIDLTVSNGNTESVYPYIGSGVGGSSLFYASALERLARHDIEATEEIEHPTGGWPIGYDEFTPWYEEAEKQFFVCGDQDNLSPDGDIAHVRTPPPLSAGDQILVEDFKKRGLNPYRMHVGIKFKPDCMECTGRVCPYSCKMDGRSAGVVPALKTGRAAVLDYAEVTCINGEADRVTSLTVEKDGETITVTGENIILSAGGISSPALLLASANEAWPNGCANQSDLVGRNLMFHAHEFVAAWPSRKGAFDFPRKSLALRDFYYVNGQRLGLMHSLGLTASYGYIVGYLQALHASSLLKNFKFLRHLVRPPAMIATKLFGDAAIFSCLIEDRPYLNNRVKLNNSNLHEIAIDYKIHNEFKKRRNFLRRHVRKKIGLLKSMPMNAKLELNYGHPCGTVRFGDDPKSSVLDINCRAHDIENLYVVDSSFMPSSGGVNPSLTIIANALRVGNHIVKKFKNKQKYDG